MLSTACMCILAPLSTFTNRTMAQQPSFLLLTLPIFTPANVAQLPHHLPALKTLMICPLMELYRWSDVTQNLPQSPFPVTMLQAEYILPLLPHCPLHFLLELGSRLNFCIDLVQKKGQRNQIRGVLKAFP